MLTFRMDSTECGTTKISNTEGAIFVTVPQIGMIGVLQVRVDVVGRAMQLVDNHMHFSCNSRIIVYVTVKKLHEALLVQLFSNVYNYLY